MGEAQCGGHSGLENFTSKESISLDYLLITDERMYFLFFKVNWQVFDHLFLYIFKQWGDNIFFKYQFLF